MFPCCNLCYEKYIRVDNIKEFYNSKKYINKEEYVECLKNKRNIFLSQEVVDDLDIKRVCTCSCHIHGVDLMH